MNAEKVPVKLEGTRQVPHGNEDMTFLNSNRFGMHLFFSYPSCSLLVASRSDGYRQTHARDTLLSALLDT